MRARQTIALFLTRLAERISGPRETPQPQNQHETALLDSLLDSIPELVFYKDIHGVYLGCNTQFTQFVGKSRDEIIGKTDFDLFDQETADAYRENDALVLETNEPRRNEEWITYPDDGQRALLDTLKTPYRGPDGELIGVLGVCRDITELKKNIDALELRLGALTRPTTEPAEISFESLFDLNEIQRLQDEFAEATGVAAIIARPDGTPITAPSNPCRLCNDIIRTTPRGLANCYHSNATLGRAQKDGPSVQPCLSAGLWDAGAAIVVGGEHIANWLIGQVRDETQTVEEIRAYATQIGADPDEAAQAFLEVPIMSKNQFEKIARALFTLAKQLSTIAYQNQQQARVIAQRERAENVLRASEKRYRNLANLLPQVIWEIDKEGRFTYFNEAVKPIFGWDVAELSDGIFIPQVVAPESLEHLLSNMQRVLRGKERIGGNEYLCQRKDGSRLPTMIYSEPIRDEESNSVLRGITIDVSELKQAEQELRESEARYKALHTASSGGIAIHEQGVILECNQGLSTMTGYSIEELIGMDGLRLIAEPSRETVLKNISEGYEQPYEAIGSRKNGSEYPIRIEGRNVPYKGRKVRSVEFRDLTDSKRAQEEQRMLQEQLNQSQKMEAVGQLAGGVAHDFNNLLQAILGYGDLARIETREEDPVREFIDEILKATRRAKAVVAQLLAYSRQQVLETQVVDLNSTIHEMLNMLHRIIGENIELQFLDGDNLKAVLADPGKISQILTNLCVNARDAMPNGGVITIKTQRVDGQTQTDHAPPSPGEFISLSVSDTGHGMSKEVKDKAFDPFYTTKELGKGTGLGLSSVYGLVQQHNGSIHIMTEENKGSTIEIYLPATDQEAEPRPPSKTPSSPLLGGSETVLLAEDEEIVRSLTKIMLEKSGYTVLTANDGEDAIAMIEQHAAEIDLLLLDVMMPKLSGREVYEHIRTSHPHLKTLFASGYSKNDFYNEFILKDGLQLIQKPIERKNLLRKIREILDTKENDHVATN